MRAEGDIEIERRGREDRGGGERGGEGVEEGERE